MNDYYDYDSSYDNEDDEILGKSKRQKTFVKVGRTFLQMQRPHFDADALIYKVAHHGIRRIRSAVGNRRKSSMLRSNEA